jgi:glycosyltransferase involved in cell wall biosynthesis
MNISFIIPAYNCAKTIDESIGSIIDGNLEPGDEIVITDDGSTDDTRSIIERHASNPVIKLVMHPQNTGGGAARNTCVKNSKHPLIFCLDSDNLLEPDSVKKLKCFLIENCSDVAVFQELRYFKSCSKEITHRWVFRPGNVSLQDCLANHIVPPASGNYLFTKESWESVGGYPEFAKALDTWGFGVRQLAHGCKMTVLADTGYFHRYGHESYWTRESRNNQISSIATQILEPYQHLLTVESVAYMQSESGSNWFGDLESRPILVVGANLHRSGYIVKEVAVSDSVSSIKKMLRPCKAIVKKNIRHEKFLSSFNAKKELLADNRFTCRQEDLYPCFDEGGLYSFTAHYGYHTAWAARVLARTRPEKHVDISSCLRFVSLVSAFVPIDFYDYRPAHLALSGMTVNHADITALPFQSGSIPSLSSMHVVEHIGLTRYGDPFDPQGDVKAMRELARVLAPGGHLLFVVPVGREAIIQFNAHRIYTPQIVVNSFPGLSLREFSYITDAEYGGEHFFPNADFTDVGSDRYGCGCFLFTR